MMLLVYKQMRESQNQLVAKFVSINSEIAPRAKINQQAKDE
ncbi:hypothetical protein CKA32_004384 [Geitlerinema sp. FC II]|nr:hypothetical protein CKA32_004384 [Geitlerinema sp. FC II]